MPNWVKNRLVLTGKKNEIESIIDAMSVDGLIDFNKVKPMPEVFHELSSPVKIISESEYKEQMKTYEDRKANPSDMDKLTGITHGITRKMQHKLIEKYGCDNWYDWSCANWGTKWNACHAEKVIVNVMRDATSATFNFDTAWACPVAFIEALSSKYPDVLITIAYADEDIGSNVGRGVIQNGIWLAENVPASCSKDAYELAFQMWPEMREYYKLNDKGEYEYNEE